MEHCFFLRSKTGHVAIKLVAYYRMLPCFHWKMQFLSTFNLSIFQITSVDRVGKIIISLILNNASCSFLLALLYNTLWLCSDHSIKDLILVYC